MNTAVMKRTSPNRETRASMTPKPPAEPRTNEISDRILVQPKPLSRDSIGLHVKESMSVFIGRDRVGRRFIGDPPIGGGNNALAPEQPQPAKPEQHAQQHGQDQIKNGDHDV